jgi:gas vesicle structural protein
MNRRRMGQAQAVIQQADVSMLELVDHVLNKGVVVTGDVILGLADVDLIYLRVSALLCAADRIQSRLPKGEA